MLSGTPPAITSCFHATISTPSGCLRRSIAQNFCAPTYFTARQSDVAQTFFFGACGSIVTIRPTMAMYPVKPAATGSFIHFPLPSLRFLTLFFSLFLRRPLALPRCIFLHPPLSRADRNMPRTDRRSPSRSRGHHGPPRDTRDHTRGSEDHSDDVTLCH